MCVKTFKSLGPSDLRTGTAAPSEVIMLVNGGMR
jgi:hypothetical protein